MSKKSLIKKIQIIEKDDMVYSIVYCVYASQKGGSAALIHSYFSLEDAMDKKELLDSFGIFETVFIIEDMVWF